MSFGEAKGPVFIRQQIGLRPILKPLAIVKRTTAHCRISYRCSLPGLAGFRSGALRGA